LVHECWTYEVAALAQRNLMTEDEVQYLWLPLSHSFGKLLQIAHIRVGFVTAVDGRVDKLLDNFAVVRPTFMGAAPRIFEKVYNKVVSAAKDAGGARYRIFRWAVRVGRDVSRRRQRGEQPRGRLRVEYDLADRLVFRKLRARFGGRVRFFISGSAPLSRDIAEFFHAAGIVILEGYGLTETSAASFVNLHERVKFGTVGLAIPGTQVRIAEEDGEILIRGKGVMRGYHNLPEQTAAVLDADGWLRTGDIGTLDADGFLTITDRKKDLIKTSGGKYVAPQLLEGKVKAACPYAGHVIVHGDRRKYVTALIALDEEAVRGWASKVGLVVDGYEQLAHEPRVRALVQRSIDEVNATLARYETIKRFALLPRDLSIEGGELTPSLKVKRRVVEERYADLLDGMYEDATVAL